MPRQLPLPPGTFVGRTTELHILEGTLAAYAADTLVQPDGPTVVISTIGGSGGIGKTWLALTWAQRHLDRFPDGQLFADLRGFSPTGLPTTPGDALRGFLEALGVGRDHQPSELDAQAALYRSKIADKRMLIVLDNAATTDQVIPLLPGTATCTVLITSRNRLPALLTRHGARPLHLDVLTDAESRGLLAAALGQDRVTAAKEAVADLIALCGGFPLALGLIAARAAAEPHLPLAETVAALRGLGLDALDSDDPSASLPAVLSWSLRRLTDLQRTVFGLLGIAPGPDIGLPAVASLTGLPARETHAVLRELADASLIDCAPGGRYSMHDLVRAYATTHAHTTFLEPVRTAALERVVDFYLHTARTAHRLLAPYDVPIRPDRHAPEGRPHPLPDQPAAMAWLEAEHPHLLAAQHMAVIHHRHHSAVHLAWNLTVFHWRRGHRHDDLTVWQAALNAAEHLMDFVPRISAHRYLGRAHSRLGQHEQASKHLDQALALAQHHCDILQQAHTHYEFSMSCQRRGDDREALIHAQQSLDLYRTTDNQVLEAKALNLVGWYAARLGEYDAARGHCQAALTLHRHHHDPDGGEAYALDSLGFIDHRTGDHHQAIRHYQQALALFRNLGNIYDVADTLDRLGHPHVALGQYDQARVVWREALTLYREQGRNTDAERVQQQLDGLDHSDDDQSHESTEAAK
ncbi:tetratricopeptide repeat protein [Actinocrispum sp. NPDC049592]|uniref:ATP-binding protein n=1 Tax=Actinocrispum sp. NPDC049592 TaxID=3154835 RepID=UPI003439BA6C